MSTWLPIVGAVAGMFVVSDATYALDHYLVHFDRERYKDTHRVHHVRYGGSKRGPHLAISELKTYGTAAVMATLGASVLTLFTGNVGFVLGAVLKFAHTLLFHLYQHHWWGDLHVRAQKLGKPKPRWGLALAKYHAYHHSNPDERPFTYAESWAGWDRILEWAHPWLQRYTVDGRRKLQQHRASPEELS